jgi:hypothetical protein
VSPVRGRSTRQRTSNTVWNALGSPGAFQTVLEVRGERSL